MKTAPKKVTKKTAPKKVTVQKTVAAAPVESKDYTVELVFDGCSVKEQTSDIAEYVRSLGLKYIKTNLIVRVTYNERTIERVLNRQAALRAFRNDISAMALSKAFKLAFNVR